MTLQVVVGVLTKYVNLGKGWRHRLFVLKNGVLQYYKVNAAAPSGSLIPACLPVHCSRRKLLAQGHVPTSCSDAVCSGSCVLRPYPGPEGR